MRDNDHDGKEEEISFIYDENAKATCIEKIFGEEHHVKDKHVRHQISIRFIVVLMTVYMVQGGRDCLTIAMQYYFAAVFDIGPSEVNNFRTIVFLPWSIKVIYGLIIDSIPIYGYKRKIYMLFFGILGPCMMLIILFCGTKSYNIQLICMTIISVSNAFCDVIADALTVERTEFKSHSVASRLQALAWGSRTIASISGILIGTELFKSGEPTDILKVYWLYFGVLLLIPVFGILLPEARNQTVNVDHEKIDELDEDERVVDSNHSIKKIFYLTFQTLCRKSIFYPVLFMFIFDCTPNSGTAWTYYMIYDLDFNSKQIGYLYLIGSVTFLCAIGIVAIQSRKSNNNFNLQKQFWFWTIIAFILPFGVLIVIFGINKDIGIPDFVFIASDSVLVGIVGQLLFMYTLILSARICPPGIEGFFMTVLVSIINGGSSISLQISTQIINGLNIECIEDPDDVNRVECDFHNLWILIIIVNATTLLPLIFIKSIPNEEELNVISKQLQDLDKDEQHLEKKDMIGLYWLCMDYIYPCFKCICCNGKEKEQEVDCKNDNDL